MWAVLFIFKHHTSGCYKKKKTPHLRLNTRVIDIFTQYYYLLDSIILLFDKNCTLAEFAHQVFGAVANIEIRLSLLSMVQWSQFGKLPSEDSNMHIGIFLELTETLQLEGHAEEVMHLRLFPFSLRDKARVSLQTIPERSITTWDQLEQTFLNKYFPLLKLIIWGVKF